MIIADSNFSLANINWNFLQIYCLLKTVCGLVNLLDSKVRNDIVLTTNCNPGDLICNNCGEIGNKLKKFDKFQNKLFGNHI